MSKKRTNDFPANKLEFLSRALNCSDKDLAQRLDVSAHTMSAWRHKGPSKMGEQRMNALIGVILLVSCDLPKPLTKDIRRRMKQ